ncbi:MAG: hypothetical protein CVV44_01445 [Spirochaetae bacterium HGW-Spirochaetae-1]|nr:MAG: hypothetical protein CVV44_01445 [Spirochaetae bacterium HGW-Spirochaetae-1]
MRLLPVMIIVTIMGLAVSADHLWGARYEVSGEYRRDVIDYDENRREFSREKVLVDFDGDITLFLAHSYVRTLEEHDIAWNIFINNILPGSSLIMGNFMIHCGSGLIVGVRQYESSSPFASRPFPTASFVVKPAYSGSPVYSFHGIAASQKFLFEPLSCSLYSFYSMRPRFISEDDFKERKVGSSLGTINGKTGERFPSVEPVYIRNFGLTAEIKGNDSCSLQMQYMGTDLTDSRLRALSWDFREDLPQESGLDGVTGLSIFARYGDDYFDAYAEAAMTGKSRTGKRGYIWNDGYAFSGGIRLRHPLFALACTSTMTGNNYYAPDSSTAGLPRREWDMALSVRPWGALEAGASHTGERKTVPGLYEKDLRSKIRERCYVKWHGKKLETLLDLSWIHKEGSGNEEKEIHGKGDVSCFLGKRVRADLGALSFHSVTCQKTSWSVMTGMAVTPIDILAIAFSYVRVQADKKVPLYLVVLPLQNALASGISERGAGNILACKLALKSGHGGFSLRYEQHLGQDGKGESRLEASGRLWW